MRMIANKQAVVALAMSALGLFGCFDQPVDASPCGEDGELVQLEGAQFVCVYRGDIVIETGFSCPSAYATRHDRPDYTVCAKPTTIINESIFAYIREFMRRRFIWDISDEPGELVQRSGVDLLWVVDNSGSMCRQQQLLRENFSRFVDQFADASRLDVQLGVTTTHVPAATSASARLEPLAQAGHLQSQPQPVPGLDQRCIGADAGEAPRDGYLPLRQSLKVALSCLAQPDMASRFDWSDAQIGCALDANATRCADELGLEDRNRDDQIDLFDLFPAPSDYIPLPKFLRLADYRDAAGALDRPRLERDFGCMSLVGTRGDGIEKGLKAAILAVNPALTGFSPGHEAANASRPNHGFIRKDSGFGLVFISDENDCTHDGTLDETSACASWACEAYNSEALEGQSPLVAPEALAEQWLDALSQTKGRPVSRHEVLVASIHGQWARQREDVVALCSTTQQLQIEPSCQAPWGPVFSGDRYERFMRQFPNFYPNEEVLAAGVEPADFSVKAKGLMCQGQIQPALDAIGAYIARYAPK